MPPITPQITASACLDFHAVQSLGTVTHAAPELLMAGRLGTAADVYSFGVLSKCCTQKTTTICLALVLMYSYAAACAAGNLTLP